jgi:hypothetical protein
MPWGCRCRLIAARLTVSFEFVLDCVEASLCAGLVILRGRAADPDAADMHAAGSHDRKPALNHGDARQKGDPPGPPIRIAVGEIRRFACRAGRRSNGCGAKLLGRASTINKLFNPARRSRPYPHRGSRNRNKRAVYAARERESRGPYRRAAY